MTETKELKLDYTDQCDLVFGRIRRLVESKPEILEHLDGLSAVDLGVDGLGLSGEQVAMVIKAVRIDKAQLRKAQESIEDSWCVIANATDWDNTSRKEWKAAAERWRDRYVSGKSFLDAGEVRDVLPTLPVLDYNEQCDIAFGRICRLIDEHPQARHAENMGELGELGLDLIGLGLSGEQVYMAFDKAKLMCNLADAADANEVLTELDSILTGANINLRSTVEAVKGGDLVGRVLRLVASRKVAVDQWEAAQATEDDAPAPVTSHPHDADTVE